MCVVSLILHFTKWLPFFVLYFMHIQSIELHNCSDDGGLGLLHGFLLILGMTGVSQPLTLQKHLGYFNHIFRLSQLHQSDQRNAIN